MVLREEDLSYPQITMVSQYPIYYTSISRALTDTYRITNITPFALRLFRYTDARLRETIMKKEIELVCPSTPNFVKDINGGVHDIKDFSIKEIEELGKLWIDKLKGHAETRRNDNQ